MTPQELKLEIGIELAFLNNVVQEILDFKIHLDDDLPSPIEKSGIASYLAQFYNGIENILKRISLFHSVELPLGENWHIVLFRRFCEPAYSTLPVLFPPPLESEFTLYRKFRHVVMHSYGFQIDWDRLEIGVNCIAPIYERFKEFLIVYLNSI